MISADGGMLVLFVWNQTVKLHIFIHEQAKPEIHKLLILYNSLYGVPVLLPPTLHLSANRMRHAA